MSVAIPSLRGAIAVPRWAKNELWRKAQAAPSLDLRFADSKSLVDATTGQTLVTFTRASGATFVDSQGVIRNATTNLLLRSEEFNDAAWTKSESTITENSVSAPNGTITADKLIVNTATAVHSVRTPSVSYVSGAVYTFTVYAKAAEYSTVGISTSAVIAGEGEGVYTLLGNGTADNYGADAVSINAVGNGWYRLALTVTAASTTTSASVFRILVHNGVTGFFTGDGTSGIYIWGAQLEQSSTVGEYVPTGATINSAPRFDHNPTTGESLGLLVEEARTNSIRNNTMVGAVAGTPGTLPTNWSLLGGTGLTTQVVGIGTENGITYLDFKFSGTTGTTFTGLQFDVGSHFGITTATAYTASVYLKRVAGSLTNLSQPSIFIRYNLSPSGQTDISSAVSSLAAPTDGLTRSRYTVTGTTTGTVSGIGAVFILFSHSSGVAVDLTLRIGLPQLEQGAFATSVIPTTGTAATRSADVASITGSAFSGWYRQDQGTMFTECAVTQPISGGNQFVFRSSDSTFNNAIAINISGGFGVAQLVTAAGGVFDGTANSVLPLVSNVPSRIASAYAANNLGVSLNGATTVTDATVTIPTALTRADIGSDHIGANRVKAGTIKRLTYWPQRLANSTLQSLTQ